MSDSFAQASEATLRAGHFETNPLALQAQQDAAIMAAAERHEEAGGLRVVSMAAGIDTPMGRMKIEFSDGEAIYLSKQQVAAIRSM